MKKEQAPRKRRTIPFTSPRSRLAPRWLRRLYQIGHAFPRFIAWLTNLPHFSLFCLIFAGAAAVFLRVALDNDPLSGLAVAAIGGPLLALVFFLLLPLLIPLAAVEFLLVRLACRFIARLGGWVLPEPKAQAGWRIQGCSGFQPLAQALGERDEGWGRPEDKPVRVLLAKVAGMWARE